MARRLMIAVGGAVGIAVIAGGGVAVAIARSDDDGVEHDVSITGDALAEATDAALAHTGGGRVTGTEVGDEESYYEVEVTLDDGRQVDVQLDRAFHVAGSSEDHEGAADDD